jgi:hypothetical protein
MAATEESMSPGLLGWRTGRALRRGLHCLLAATAAAGAARADDFIRGDANGDGGLSIVDPQFTLNYLFLGGTPPACLAAADVDDSEDIVISDPIATLNFLFLGGDPPRPPYPGPGRDPTPGLGCGLEAPAGLLCRKVGPAVELSWTLVASYDAIEVVRDGEVVATLGGAATSFRDRPLAGGDHSYEVRGVEGSETTSPASCSVTRLPVNQPPAVALLFPAQGSVVQGGRVTARGRASDDTGVARVLVNGIDVTPPGAAGAPFLDFEIELPLAPGPHLVRAEAVDEFGRASFHELALGSEPLIRAGAAAPGLLLDLTGSTGYAELEVIVQPFLGEVPALLDAAVRGRVLFDGNVVVNHRVTGDRVEVTGAIGFDLFPSAASGGRIGLEVRLERVRLFANGRSDYGFLGTDNWRATFTADNVVITGTFAFSPRPGGAGLDVASDGFTVVLGSSDLRVDDFGDPLGILNGLVNLLGDLFQDQIEAEVRAAVEQAMNDEVLPILAEAFGNLKLDLDLGNVFLETFFNDVLETGNGLSMLFDAAWHGSERAPSFPPYPGSSAGFAPFPTLPLNVAASHAVDATISLSVDTLNQALMELVASGLLETALDLGDLDSPIPLETGVLASIIDPRLGALPGLEADTPLGLRVAADFPATLAISGARLGRPIVAEGERWRFFRGVAEPLASWPQLGFNDATWETGASGFGYSTNPLELRSVRTDLDDMARGLYGAVYLRKLFHLDNPAALGGLFLRVLYDDAFVVYLNGQEVGRRNITGAPPLFSAPADGPVEPILLDLDLNASRGLLRTGQNVLAVQGHNADPMSSDFVLVPQLLEPAPLPPGALGAVPVDLDVQSLTVTFAADVARDGVGAADADGVPDDVELFSYSLHFRLAAALLLIAGEGGAPTIAFSLATGDGPDADTFPDAIVGGAAGLEISVAREVVDVDDEVLIGFAQLLLSAFGSTLTESLAGLELPSLPLPELEFDLDGNGAPDVRLDIVRSTLVPVDTTGEGEPDWVCILSDLRSGPP